MTSQQATTIEMIEADLANETHAAAVVDLINRYSQTTFGQSRPLDAAVQTNLIPALRSHPTTRIILAQRGSEYVGIAVCFVGFSTFKARPLLNVHDIYVREDQQGQGIGGKLLEAVAAAAKASNCCKVTLECMDGNTKAMALYQRCGFELGVIGDDAHRFLSRKL